MYIESWCVVTDLLLYHYPFFKGFFSNHKYQQLMKIKIDEKKLFVGSNYALGGNTLHNTTKGSNELKPR